MTYVISGGMRSDAHPSPNELVGDSFKLKQLAGVPVVDYASESDHLRLAEFYWMCQGCVEDGRLVNKATARVRHRARQIPRVQHPLPDMILSRPMSNSCTKSVASPLGQPLARHLTSLGNCLHKANP